MKITDRLRLESAVQRYDFWLEMRGVRGSRRRELRRELRTNLAEASADVGTTRALFGIGSPKELAYAAVEADPSKPMWSRAATWAGLTAVLVLFGIALTSLTVLQTVEASGVSDEVRVSPFPWFGTTFTAEANDTSFSAGFETPWPLLVLPLLVFLLGARPWRLLRRGQGSAALAGR